MSSRRSPKRREAKKLGFRSAFEQSVAEALDAAGVYWVYEPKSDISYVPKPKKYTPDFVLDNGVIIECKGRLTVFDRVKHLLIKEQCPELDIRFVFQFDNKLTRNSKTRYSEWCEKHGFQYAFKEVPESWVTKR